MLQGASSLWDTWPCSLGGFGDPSCVAEDFKKGFSPQNGCSLRLCRQDVPWELLVMAACPAVPQYSLPRLCYKINVFHNKSCKKWGQQR